MPAQKLLPGGLPAALRRRLDPVPFQNLSDRAARNCVPQIGTMRPGSADSPNPGSPLERSLFAASGDLFSAIRAAAFGAGLYRTLGLPFAITFAVLITAGQVFGYSRGMRPSRDYAPSRRPRVTRRHLWGAARLGTWRRSSVPPWSATLSSRGRLRFELE